MNKLQELKAYSPSVILGVFGIIQCMFVLLLSTAKTITLHVNGRRTIVAIAEHEMLFLGIRLILVLLALVCFFFAYLRIRRVAAAQMQGR